MLELGVIPLGNLTSILYLVHSARASSMNRVVVIGSSCSGKSTFSRYLSGKFEIEYIELDQLHWLPDWVEREDGEFRALVSQAVLSESWVLDGNYSVVRDIVWPRATTIIWLNHSFGLVLYRAITRSVIRAVTRQPLFSGNVETFRQTFLSRESIIWWVLKTYHLKRRRYAVLLQEQKVKGVKVFEFNSQKAVDAYLKCSLRAV
ncbi:MAG: adenylate kinase family enzyme [Candidatus Azotimanducaceae bacterium]|jgi:adenylate kinase family enzyme